MSTSFEMWNTRLTEANDEISRRKLIGELGVWRAAHLSDIPAMRSAAFAMSRLYMLVGDHPSAVNEARSLYSLCQTAPVATGEEFKKARAYLRSLGLVVGDAGSLVEKKKGSARDPAEETRQRIREGDLTGAMKLLKGRKGPKASLFRVWIELSRALKREDPVEALQEVRRLQQQLGRRLDVDGPSSDKKAGKKADKASSTTPAAEADDPVAQLMGLKSLPRKRDPKVRLMERFVKEHPERLDELVSVALQSHVDREGPKRTAPWLAGFVARALVAAPQGKTQHCVDALSEQGAYAVTAYQETGATRGIALLGFALENGWNYEGFRRGVMRDGRLEGHKTWTLRLSQEGSEKMVALVADGVDGLDAELQGKVLESLHRISPSALLAFTAEQPTFQGQATEKGFTCVVSSEPQAVLEALSALPGRERSAARPSKSSPLSEALRASEPPTVETLVPLIETYRRTYKSFEASRGLLRESGISDAQERLATFLKAADQVAPENVKLNEGMTVVVQGAAQIPEGPLAQLLQDPSAQRRYGGPGVLEILPIGRAVVEAGWSIRRAMLGPTRRERDTHPDLGEGSDALWRLIVDGEAQTGEVWFTKVSGEQAQKLLALIPSDRSCVVLSPELPELGEEATVPTLAWDGSQGEALTDMVRSWSKSPEQTPESTN